jgi:hypothetical protein
MIIKPGEELGHMDIEAQRTSQALQQDYRSIHPSAASTGPDQQHGYRLMGDPNESESTQANTYPDPIFPGSQEPLGPPPAFAPYEAEWFEVGHGDIVSHDEHLNTDGKSRLTPTPRTRALINK